MKKIVKQLFHSFGLDIRRLPKNHQSDLVRILDSLGITVVLDVGANAGQFSSNLRRHGFFGRIISFEPTINAYESLLKNAADDKLWHVHDRAAIGAHTGTVKINIAGNQAQSSSILEMGTLHKESAPHSVYVGVEEVSLITIDSIFSSYADSKDSVLLKIDVQGYEEQVLNGAQNSLASILAVKLELSLASLYEGDKDYRFYFSMLEELGFQLWDVEPGHRHPVTGRLLQFDAVYVHRP